MPGAREGGRRWFHTGQKLWEELNKGAVDSSIDLPPRPPSKAIAAAKSGQKEQEEDTQIGGKAVSARAKVRLRGRGKENSAVSDAMRAGEVPLWDASPWRPRPPLRASSPLAIQRANRSFEAIPDAYKEPGTLGSIRGDDSDFLRPKYEPAKRGTNTYGPGSEEVDTKEPIPTRAKEKEATKKSYRMPKSSEEREDEDWHRRASKICGAPMMDHGLGQAALSSSCEIAGEESKVCLPPHIQERLAGVEGAEGTSKHHYCNPAPGEKDQNMMPRRDPILSSTAKRLHEMISLDLGSSRKKNQDKTTKKMTTRPPKGKGTPRRQETKSTPRQCMRVPSASETAGPKSDADGNLDGDLDAGPAAWIKDADISKRLPRSFVRLLCEAQGTRGYTEAKSYSGSNPENRDAFKIGMGRAALLDEIVSAESAEEAFSLIERVDRMMLEELKLEREIASARTRDEVELVNESKERRGRFEPRLGDGFAAMDSNDGHHSRFVRHRKAVEEEDPSLWQFPYRFEGEDGEEPIVDDSEADDLRRGLLEQFVVRHPESFDDVPLGGVVPAIFNTAAGIKVETHPTTVIHFDTDFDSRCRGWLTEASEVAVQRLARALGFTAYSYDDLDALKEWIGGKLAQFCNVAQGYCGPVQTEDP